MCEHISTKNEEQRRQTVAKGNKQEEADHCVTACVLAE